MSLICIAGLLLTGCVQSSADEIIVGTKNNNEVFAQIHYGISVKNTSDTDFIREIVKEVNVSRFMSEEEHRNDGFNYRETNIPNLNEFYFPNIEFDDYELFQVNILPQSFGFYYVPKNTNGRAIDKNSRLNEVFNFDTGILLIIHRIEVAKSSPLKTLEDVSDMFRGGEIVGDLYYTESNNVIRGFINGTQFTMQVPNRFNNIETLQKLHRQLIATTELVNVDAEIARLALEGVELAEDVADFIDITDALEILMYLAGMDSKAAPGSTIMDALDILIYLAGLEKN
jgi:hypothetical protein